MLDHFQHQPMQGKSQRKEGTSPILGHTSLVSDTNSQLCKSVVDRFQEGLIFVRGKREIFVWKNKKTCFYFAGALRSTTYMEPITKWQPRGTPCPRCKITAEPLRLLPIRGTSAKLSCFYKSPCKTQIHMWPSINQGFQHQPLIRQTGGISPQTKFTWVT